MTAIIYGATDSAAMEKVRGSIAMLGMPTE